MGVSWVSHGRLMGVSWGSARGCCERVRDRAPEAPPVPTAHGERSELVIRGERSELVIERGKRSELAASEASPCAKRARLVQLILVWSSAWTRRARFARLAHV